MKTKRHFIFTETKRTSSPGWSYYYDYALPEVAGYKLEQV